MRLFTGNRLSLALDKDVVSSSLKTSLLVGSMLVVINYGDAILSGAISTGDFVKIVLTYCVPYSVSTYATLTAHRSIETGEKI